MQRRLSKEESRQRYAQGRELWNQFDPIGVFQIDVDWSKDEYEGYVGPCIRAAEVGDEGKLVEYTSWAVFENMGLSPTDELKKAVNSFASKFMEWYRSKWADTVV
jgi:hypothetical protein